MPLNDTAHTLGLLGAKGGVGTTVLASSLAWALAERGLRVVLLDLDQHGGQAALHLCERNAGPTLNDAMQVIDRLDPTLLDTLLTPCSPRLRLLPAPRLWMEGVDDPMHQPASLARLVATATELADCVVLDLPTRAPLNPAFAPLLSRLDRLELVTEPSLPATFNARRLWQWLDRQGVVAHAEGHGVTKASVVLNQVHRHQALPSAQVWRTLGFEENGATSGRELPRSETAVAQAIYQGQALGEWEPADALSKAVAQWAQELATAWAPPPPMNAADGAKADGGWAHWRGRLMGWAS